jgi:hypothetical protein
VEEQATRKALKRYHPDENRVTPSFLDLLRLNIENGATKDNHTINDIDHVLLTGGPMHMPCIRKAIKEIFATNERVLNELEEIEDQGFPVDPIQCVAMGAALYEHAGNQSLYHYAVVNIELPNENAKTDVYCYPENYLPSGIKPPETRSVDVTVIKRSTEVQAETITVLVGEEDIFSSVHTIHWKKCRTFTFKPVFTGGEYSYTIQLVMNDDQVVTVIVEDLNLKELKTQTKPYSFIAMLEEELPLDKYNVIIGRPPLEKILTYGLTPPLVLEGKFTCIKAEAWLKEKREPEEEQNRPQIEEYVGILKSLLDKLESLAEGIDPNTPITGQKLLALMEIVRNAIRELIK